ncbi:DoxX family membrane protein [Flavobacterium haoranii]|uniref:DoxX protein n=1 Tax=Flavobacterium haoranii TaxID=683124 RepID=A0A1M6LIG2_9FLAO|nr:DoxX family membrane protein [Flavobacterium haoranii]SHJ70905.1 DoxX protein [Flavobacterium haoranii]
MKVIFYWIIRIFPAIIMLQTLFYKFTAAPESVAIFSKLHAEPFGRIGTGIIELIASILILIPNKSRFGAILGFGTMFGAIISHIFILGINVNHEGGQLFTLAIITIICFGLVLFEERKKISIFQKS